MSITQEPFGQVGDEHFTLYRLTNSRGASLAVTNYGATAVELILPAPSGETADVLLGFDSAAGYRASTAYHGATVGRFANRIRGGRFVLDGVTHHIPPNDGPNALHGGKNGFHARKWIVETDTARNAIRFSLVSPDGDEGFPGKLQVSADYTLTEDNAVRIVYRATTDKPTLCNLAQHSYFNLRGHDSGTILDHYLQIEAGFFAPESAELLPTGEVRKVDGTPFDFQSPKPIDRDIGQLPPETQGRGYDHNYCIRGEPGRLRLAATLHDPKSGRSLAFWTTEPGMHLYVGGFLDGTEAGKGGARYRQFAGLALETQRFPDAPSHSHFPQARLDPGEVYEHILEWRAG